MAQTELHVTRAQQWADFLREKEMVGIGMLLLDVLKVWGFVGSQFLWMLAPFGNRAALASAAETLEDPASLQQIQDYLRAGED